MTVPDALYQWIHQVTTRLPTLSKTQARLLALYSYGMILARSCGISSVTLLLSCLLQTNPANLRQRLREFYYDKQDKRGKKRTDLKVEACFVHLLAWALSLWQGQQIALALDATTLGARFQVLVVSLLYRGCAIPVAWTLLPAHQKHAWRREWLRMLRLLWCAVPPQMTVIVLADRALYARWLFRRLVRLGWHPLLRINNRGAFRPQGQDRFVPFLTLLPTPGSVFCGRGTAFCTKSAQLECTLLACWREGCKDPWLLLTDLAPEAGEACWYGFRAWIEQGFKVLKRAGWQWQNTRMTDPHRASRVWLVLSVATLWLLSVGAAEAPENGVSEGTLVLLSPDWLKKPRPLPATRLAMHRVFRVGWVRILTALLRQDPLPRAGFLPEPWPLSHKGATQLTRAA